MDQMPNVEVYLDILFILNFVMDYFIFWMVSKITYRKVKRTRLGVGALIAATLYCLVVVVPCLRTLNIIIYLIILPLIPIHIIFKPKKIREWIQFFVIANITALVIGGMSYGMLYWVQEENLLTNIYVKFGEKFSVGILLASVIGSYIIIKSYGYYMQKRNTQIQRLFTIKIGYNKQTVALEALLDTGNKVYDPISKDPVIIVEYKILESLLPSNVRESYMEQEDITRIIERMSESDFGERIRLIPYYSLGNPNGILLGFKPDYVYIETNTLETYLVEDVIIGIYKHRLSGENTYHGLLHGDLVRY